MVVERLGVHRADQRDVVGARRRGAAASRTAPCRTGRACVNLRGLPMRRGRLLLDEGEADVLGHRLGQRLAVQLVELRLGVEQVDLAGRAFQVDADAGLRLGGEVRRPRRERVRRARRRVAPASRPSCLQQRRQGEHADAAGAGGEEIAARHPDQFARVDDSSRGAAGIASGAIQGGFSRASFPGQEFVEVHQGPTDQDQRRGFSHAWVDLTGCRNGYRPATVQARRQPPRPFRSRRR